MPAGNSSDPFGWAASQLAQASALASPDRALTKAEPQATILIVEDHDDSRDALGLIITDLGYRTGGVEALGLLEATART